MRVLSEALQVNTKLTSLNLSGAQHVSNGLNKAQATKKQANQFGSENENALAEVLKANTTPSTMQLGGQNEETAAPQHGLHELDQM